MLGKDFQIIKTISKLLKASFLLCRGNSFVVTVIRLSPQRSMWIQMVGLPQCFAPLEDPQVNQHIRK